MKLLRLAIRFWITLTSIFSFLTGWILLAHAPKPNQAGAPGFSSRTSATLPTLEPLSPISRIPSGDDDFQSQQPFFPGRPSNASRPFFRTGGS